mgnify:CR=1 FL=1
MMKNTKNKGFTLENLENTDPKLIDLWSKISFLTLRFDNFCNAVLNSYHTLIHPAHKVICLARSGDWNAAALSLATYSSINEIENDYEKLLNKKKVSKKLKN